MSTNTSDTASNETIGFDPDALRERYCSERDKRLRTDGNAQYREVQGEGMRCLDVYIYRHQGRTRQTHGPV